MRRKGYLLWGFLTVAVHGSRFTCPAGCADKRRGRRIPQVSIHGKHARYPVMGEMQIVLHGTTGVCSACESRRISPHGWVPKGRQMSCRVWLSQGERYQDLGAFFRGKVYAYGASCGSKNWNFPFRNMVLETIVQVILENNTLLVRRKRYKVRHQ